LLFGCPLATALVAAVPAAQAQSVEDSAGKSAADGVTTITVHDTIETHEGREAEGYRVSGFDLGPLGRRSALDTPFQVQTVPQDLIRTQAVSDNWEVLKYLPSTQIEYRGGSEVGRPQSRGFEADLLGNTRIDGFAVQSHIPQPIEITDHLDVLSGLSGAFYGPMNPAGVFNYVLKRPTKTFVNEVGVSYQSDANVTERADFGGRVGPDQMFGYRLNLAHGDGRTFSDSSNLRREVASLALDAQVTPDTLVEGNIARYIYDRNGYPAAFAVATGPAGSLPDAGRLNPKGYGYDWAGVQTSIDYISGKVTHHFGPDWTLTGGLMRQNTTRIMHSVSNALDSAGGAYQVQVSEGVGHWEVTSNQLYLNGTATTGPLRHQITVGSNGYYSPGFAAYNTTLATQANPRPSCAITVESCAVNALAWKTDGGYGRTGLEDRYQAVILGDTVAITDQISVLGVVSNGWISSDNAVSSRSISVDNAQSYTVGVIVKPRPDMTVYANHGVSVLPGDRAPASSNSAPVANANQALDPYKATQWEVGYKVELSGLDINAALFHIERPTAYAGADNIYRVQGQQRNRGAELMLKGKITDAITLFGGFTWLDTIVTETDTRATEGKQAIGVPEWQANLLAEYAFPESVLPGTVASVNVHYTGERAANAYNTAWADAYTTLDLGLRTTAEAWGTRVTGLIKVNNVTDEHYWASIFPSNIAGDSTTSGSTAFLGEPRTYKASVTVGF